MSTMDILRSLEISTAMPRTNGALSISIQALPGTIDLLHYIPTSSTESFTGVLWGHSKISVPEGNRWSGKESTRLFMVTIAKLVVRK